MFMRPGGRQAGRIDGECRLEVLRIKPLDGLRARGKWLAGYYFKTPDGISTLFVWQVQMQLDARSGCQAGIVGTVQYSTVQFRCIQRRGRLKGGICLTKKMKVRRSGCWQAWLMRRDLISMRRVAMSLIAGLGEIREAEIMASKMDDGRSKYYRKHAMDLRQWFITTSRGLNYYMKIPKYIMSR
jgi:hypothetical protein